MGIKALFGVIQKVCSTFCMSQICPHLNTRSTPQCSINNSTPKHSVDSHFSQTPLKCFTPQSASNQLPHHPPSLTSYPSHPKFVSAVCRSPCEHHTTLNALNFQSSMHPICIGALCHHHNPIGGLLHQSPTLYLQHCALHLCPSGPFVIPSTLATPQQLLYFTASHFTMGYGSSPVLILATSVLYPSTIRLAFILSQLLL